METGTSISQSKLGVKTTFIFGDEKLTRKLSDYTGENEFDVDYLDIDMENGSVFVANMARRYYRFVALAAFASVVLLSNTRNTPHLLVVAAYGVLTIAALFFVASSMKAFRVRFTLLPIHGKPPAVKIKIIYDAKHDDILNELEARQIGVMRRRYAAIDFRNDPDKELEKFRWLLEKQVNSESEYRSAESEITHARRDGDD